MNISPNDSCPCGSRVKFKRCCRPVINGSPADSPEVLMRSRYSAYSLGDAAHIMATTHPDSPHYRSDRSSWKAEIDAFCGTTIFDGLEVLSFRVDGDRGWVEFVALLCQSGQQVPMREHSEFHRVEGVWLYLAAVNSP